MSDSTTDTEFNIADQRMTVLLDAGLDNGKLSRGRLWEIARKNQVAATQILPLLLEAPFLREIEEMIEQSPPDHFKPYLNRAVTIALDDHKCDIHNLNRFLHCDGLEPTIYDQIGCQMLNYACTNDQLALIAELSEEHRSSACYFLSTSQAYHSEDHLLALMRYGKKELQALAWSIFQKRSTHTTTCTTALDQVVREFSELADAAWTMRKASERRLRFEESSYASLPDTLKTDYLLECIKNEYNLNRLLETWARDTRFQPHAAIISARVDQLIGNPAANHDFNQLLATVGMYPDHARACYAQMARQESGDRLVAYAKIHNEFLFWLSIPENFTILLTSKNARLTSTQLDYFCMKTYVPCLPILASNLGAGTLWHALEYLTWLRSFPDDCNVNEGIFDVIRHILEKSTFNIKDADVLIKAAMDESFQTLAEQRLLQLPFGADQVVRSCYNYYLHDASANFREQYVLKICADEFLLGQILALPYC